VKTEVTVKYQTEIPDSTNIEKYKDKVMRNGVDPGDLLAIISVNVMKIADRKKTHCPHCGVEIDYVDAEGYLQGELTSEEEIEETHREYMTFTCPECGEEIIEGEEGTAAVCEALWGKDKKEVPSE
jgi:predicted RNA-binding Zn-ribbon protein involved in translation (DUF1610 family)